MEELIESELYIHYSYLIILTLILATQDSLGESPTDRADSDLESESELIKIHTSFDFNSYRFREIC